MKYTNIYDTHTHSIHSFDGNNTCSEMCDYALKMGAKGIAFTDHCDIDNFEQDLMTFGTAQFKDTLDAKNKYIDSLCVYQGIELGQGIYKKDLSNKLLSSFDYDIIIGSIHNLENMEDFYFLDYSKYDVKDLLKKYFLAEVELAKWNKTDVIAHLTYPLRYIVAREHINVDLTDYMDIIANLFEVIIKNDKALELNVSGLFMDMKDTLPSKNIIKLYHDMGGKYVTVGSDSHYSNRVCAGIDEGLDILKDCGYTHFTVFEKRQPKLIKIK